MSEYQYYEFAAIERPLTAGEMTELRAVSSRADITAQSFINHYSWGDLKAKPADWMQRYFDAFVYWANWCSCSLSLRVPLEVFTEEELKPFITSEALSFEASQTHWIIDWNLNESEDYDRFGEEDGRGWMQRLAPLRDELLRGDLRALYLGWLAASAELEDEQQEPEVPPGLTNLSAAQQALVEFIELDPDLLAAAASGSCASTPEDAAATSPQMNAWLETWPREEMTAVLKLMMEGKGPEAERQVRSRHAAWLRAQAPGKTVSGKKRTLKHLRQLADGAEGVRLQREDKERAEQEAQLRLQRKDKLQRLMTDVDKRWAHIDEWASRATASGYEQAVQALVDLAEAYTLTSSREKFDHALRRWLTRHATRPALMRRLKAADLV
jgi:hypothetical protein